MPFMCAGVYAALLHGFSQRSPANTLSANNTSVSQVRLDSPWFAAPVAGRSSCRVEFAVSADVTSSSPTLFPPLELRLHSDSSETTVWSSATDWNPSPRSVPIIEHAIKPATASRPVDGAQVGDKIVV